jgi:prepilin-type N-terminal cleavage/methylation domain-containing protein
LSIPQRRGLTLVELLVSLGIIVLISLAFGTILGQSRDVVSSTQGIIRANSAASAIAQVIRDDFVGLSKEGFLAVSNDTNGYHLVFTATGVFQDPNTPANRANAAVIDYGLDAGKHILWRRARPLIPLSGSPGISNVRASYIDAYLGQYRYGPVGVIPLPTAYYDAPALPIPPYYNLDPADIGNLWPVLATECRGFGVESFNGTTWSSNADTWTFNDDIPNSPHPWPKAIKVRFSLQTRDRRPNQPANEPPPTMDYEVICSIRD